MTPIKPGTATKLGLRKPPLAAYRRRWVMGLSRAEVEDALRDNPNLKVLREWAKVEWPEPTKASGEVVWVEQYRP